MYTIAILILRTEENISIHPYYQVVLLNMHRNMAYPPYGENTCIASLHSLLTEKHLHRNITLTLQGKIPGSQHRISWMNINQQSPRPFPGCWLFSSGIKFDENLGTDTCLTIGASHFHQIIVHCKTVLTILSPSTILPWCSYLCPHNIDCVPEQTSCR